ncbi:ras-domain-containing protein [Eremomyces bilateralis CBS 781.70]|uniref:Ras-domain-containing protein n=1 Tax=Eremomyces bilateralis CBS 781.70 TaxID=1392243 RepID=A0A6G1G9K6_9PEZI|nr:ras-domain-containing protein [Eremomyces bilateralis CBS 781.70]KAF1814703.1 ras-domain-containing protein [Eremomyces bilateralis CBS 781.70]
MSNSLEAKIVVLGSQGVGKTSLVHRYVKGAFSPPGTASTIGASFLTKRVVDVDSQAVVRLQIWDTAGQERFRSISKLYYRGANAAVLCYDITSPSSFAEMGRWLLELRENLHPSTIIHVVGTKADVVAEHPSQRAVPFERCIAYVAEHLYPSQPPLQNGTLLTTPAGGVSHTPPLTAHGLPGPSLPAGQSRANHAPLPTPPSNRSSTHNLWTTDVGWDSCHEISALTGEGVDEVFRVITRRLVEQQQAAEAAQLGLEGYSGAGGYFDCEPGGEEGGGSFRVGYGDKRRSWLGLPGIAPGGGDGAEGGEEVRRWDGEVRARRGERGGRCC